MHPVYIVYPSNATEEHKAAFGDLIKMCMEDIRKEILAADGYIEVTRINGSELAAKAFCDDRELRDRMTNKLNAAIALLWTN